MNYGKLLLDVAVRTPDAEAIKMGSETMDFATFARRVRALAAGLRAQGLRRGDGVAIWMQNRAEFLEAMTAAWVLGGYVAPINPRLNHHEVAYQVSDSEAHTLITSASLLSDEARRTVLTSPTLQLTLALDGMPTDAELQYEALIASDLDPGLEPVDTSSDELMWLFYTSGTTGRPKGVMWSHTTYAAASVITAADLFAGAPGDGVLIAAPATHGAGMVALFAMTRGAAAAFTPEGARATPQVILQTIQDLRPTTLFLTPTHIKMLLDQPDFDAYDLSSLKSIIYGGSVMLVDDLRAALEMFGGVELIQIYGQGECCTVISALSAADHRLAASTGDPDVVRRLGSAGLPRSLTEIKAVDERGADVAAGAVGELAVRGPATGIGYWRTPMASRETFRTDGWVLTGDMGLVDEHGYVYVLDRKKDMIVSGGMNIYAREIEDALIGHDAVSECAVIGVPHSVFGESVCAIVVANREIEPQALTAHVVSLIAEFKKPQRYVFVDELPKNPAGKIQKAELRRLYGAPMQDDAIGKS